MDRFAQFNCGVTEHLGSIFSGGVRVDHQPTMPSDGSFMLHIFLEHGGRRTEHQRWVTLGVEECTEIAESIAKEHRMIVGKPEPQPAGETDETEEG